MKYFRVGGVCLWLLTQAVCWGNSSDNPPPVSAREFAGMSIEAKRDAIATALRYRAAKCTKNVSYRVETRFANHEYLGESLGGVVENSSDQTIVAYWAIGDSYRMNTDRGVDLATQPYEQISSGYDDSTGVVRSIVKLPGGERPYGRIDTVHDNVTDSDRFRYWLDGEHTKRSDFIFRSILDNITVIAFEKSDETTVTIKMPWQRFYMSKSPGVITFVLDIEKGFLPLSGRGDWKDGDEWRFEEISVEKTLLVDDIWMPAKFTEIIGGSPLGKNKVAVYSTVVHMMTFDSVEQSDLFVAFPKGTMVVDAIGATSYQMGDDEKPEGDVVGLIGTDALTADRREDQPKSAWAKTAMSANVVFLLACAILLYVRKSRHSTLRDGIRQSRDGEMNADQD